MNKNEIISWWKKTAFVSTQFALSLETAMQENGGVNLSNLEKNDARMHDDFWHHNNKLKILKEQYL